MIGARVMNVMNRLSVRGAIFLCVLFFTTGKLHGIDKINESSLQQLAEKNEKMLFDQGTLKLLAGSPNKRFPLLELVASGMMVLGGGILFYSSIASDDPIEKRLFHAIVAVMSVILFGSMGFDSLRDYFKKIKKEDFDKAFLSLNARGITFGKSLFREKAIFVRWERIVDRFRMKAQAKDREYNYYLFQVLKRGKEIFDQYDPEKDVVQVDVCDRFLPIPFDQFCEIVDYFWREHRFKFLMQYLEAR